MTRTTGCSGTPECYRPPVEVTGTPGAGRTQEPGRQRSVRRRRPRRSTLVSQRAYRAGLAVLAVALLAALVGIHTPPGLDLGADAPPSFDGAAALRTARDIAANPDRTPGTGGADRAADVVARAFADAGAPVAVDRYRARGSDGQTVGMVNVVSILRGRSSDAIVVLAHRDDAAPGPDLAGSAASSAIVVELTRALVSQEHTRTVVLASVDGGLAGDAGARRLAAVMPPGIRPLLVVGIGGVTGAAALAATDRGDGTGRARAGLRRSVAQALANVPGAGALATPALSVELAEAAIRPRVPGAQAPFVDRGVPAIEVGTVGTSRAPVSTERLGAFGQALNDLVLAVDAGASIQGTQGAYLRAGDRVISGWLVALVALALLVAPALAAADLIARVLRARLRLLDRGLVVARIALPVAGAAVAIRLIALVGGLPDDPALPPFGRSGTGLIVAAVAVAAAGGAAGWFGARLLPRPAPAPTDPAERAVLDLAAALGIGTVGAALAVVVSPVAGGLLVPALHAWVFLDRVRRGGMAARAAAIWVPLLLPWAIVLVLRGAWSGEVLRAIADGRLPVATAIGTALVGGCAVLLSTTFIRRVG
jgi:hypothetical protein